MTATRDRQNESAADDTAIPWDERPVVGPWRGVPWWAAVLIGFGLAGLGAIIDIQAQDKLGLLFQGCYFVGSVAAICVVRRRNLFGPMVQPPLILGIIVPGVVLLLAGLPEGGSTLDIALAIGTPLINGFPTMAITTVVTLAIGIARIYRERDPDRPVTPRKKAADKKKAAAKAAAEKQGEERAKDSRPNQRPAERTRAQQRPRDGRDAPADERGKRKPAGQPERPPQREQQPRGAAATPPGRKSPPERGSQQGGKPPRREQPRERDAGERNPPARGKPDQQRGRSEPQRGKPEQQRGAKQPPRKQPPESGGRAKPPPDAVPAPKRGRRPSGQQDKPGQERSGRQQQPKSPPPPQRPRRQQDPPERDRQQPPRKRPCE